MKKFLLTAICFSLAFSVFAQTAAEIENLLNTDAVNYGQAARLVLLASGNPDLSPQAAFRFASEHGWLPNRAEANDQARLNGLSLLVMKAFDISGGFFYSSLGTAHYAYRELVYRNIFQGRIAPVMPVSGELLIFTVNRVLAFQESNQL